MIVVGQRVPRGALLRNARRAAFPWAIGPCLLLSAMFSGPVAAGEESQFRREVLPILERRCVRCHHDEEPQGGLSLQSAAGLRRGGDEGVVVEPGRPEASRLLQLVSGNAPEMPKNGPPLTAAEQAALKSWIAGGAAWPPELRLNNRSQPDLDWWSLRPIVKPPLPVLSAGDAAWTRNPIDVFIRARQVEQGLTPAPPAERVPLLRRLSFDLLGLPPNREDWQAFSADPDPLAYEKWVDRLLASPHYGERWARHWLDVVHYGDTHGYDKDKLRPNAWPYRDYVIRAWNEDKPYVRFVREQIAGDILWPQTLDGQVATGFISAGPWDFIGHAEIPETKIDGKVARHLDRDDMVCSTLNTFMSLTVQCAQCHDHKFDPVTQRQYYSLQAVFAALDRADRPYESDPVVAAERQRERDQQRQLSTQLQTLEAEMRRRAGPAVDVLDRQLAALQVPRSTSGERPEYGYHSQIAATANVVKWVQVDLGSAVPIEKLVYVGCWDAFNRIFHGFGFPPRFKIEASLDPEFQTAVKIVDQTAADLPNPGTKPQSVVVRQTARYIRFTATKLAPRQGDFIFALGELQVLDAVGNNLALGRPVTSLDSIEAPVRWSRRNLVDGYYYGLLPDGSVQEARARLAAERDRLLKRVTSAPERRQQEALRAELQQVTERLERLPPPGIVYSGCVHTGNGNFAGTGAGGGQPRVIHVLNRGNVQQPGDVAPPGVPLLFPGSEEPFSLPASHREGERRVRLADWLSDPRNPLTWRSIVNRLWQYHFGRGLVDSPNDFGRMGQMPTHPELLDWLAASLRDGDLSIKQVQRLIVTSATYRQSSQGAAGSASDQAAAIDGDNRYLWRMNRRRLEAEAVRDAVLMAAGRLQARMYGPGFQDFVIEKPEHSPHYEYDQHHPDDPRTHRRSIYRFLVRSQPQPFMNTLDCADPSQSVDKRNETVTALQALALLNNPFMIKMSEHFAGRLTARGETGSREQVAEALRLALSREPTVEELAAGMGYATRHGLANWCRLLFNLNEFAFVD